MNNLGIKTTKLLTPWLVEAASNILIHHGLDHQKGKAAEEFSEATTAYLQNNKHGDVVEEFADAFIMGLQMFVDDSSFGEKVRDMVAMKISSHLAIIRLEKGVIIEKV